MDELRQNIDLADREILKYFCLRMETAKAIGEYKEAHGLPTLDAAREAKKLDAAAAAVPEKYAPYARKLMESLMALSREYQNETRGLPKEEH